MQAREKKIEPSLHYTPLSIFFSQDVPQAGVVRLYNRREQNRCTGVGDLWLRRAKEPWESLEIKPTQATKSSLLFSLSASQEHSIENPRTAFSPELIYLCYSAECQCQSVGL
jgi:hypothetical protein